MLVKNYNCVFAVFCLLWVSCNKKSEAETAPLGSRDVTLSVLLIGGDETQGQWLDKVAQDFNQQYPKIQIDGLFFPLTWDQLAVKVKTMMVSGDAPDVFRMAIEGYQYVHDNKLALPLNDYIEKYPEYVEDYDDYHPKLQQAGIIDGNIYGFAQAWNNMVIYLNTDMLEEVGLPMPGPDWDQEEFLRYLQAITTFRDDGSKTYGMVIPGGAAVFFLEPWLLNFGGSVLNEELTESRLATPASKETFRFLHDLVYKYQVSPIPADDIDSLNLFISNKVGMLYAGRWFVDRLVEENINFDIQYYPTLRQNQVIYGVDMFAVTRTSKYPEESFIFASWVSSKGPMKKHLAPYAIPARISVMEEVFAEGQPANRKIFLESADFSRAVSSPTSLPEIQLVINRYYTEMMADPNADVEAMVDEMDKEVKQILADS